MKYFEIICYYNINLPLLGNFLFYFSVPV